MLKMAHTGKQHGDAAFVGLDDRIIVAYAAARLDNGFHSVFRCRSDTVIEREETVGRQHKACLADIFTFFLISSLRLFQGNFG